MLKYKSPVIETEFWHPKVSEATQYVAFWLARFCQHQYGKDIIITYVLGERPNPSAHPLGRAFDFRSHSNYFTTQEQHEIKLETVLRFGRTDSKPVIIFHGQGEDEHGHVQT